MSNTLQHYQKLASKLDLKQFETGTMQCDNSNQFTFDQADKLQAHIAALKPQQGWICYQSGIRHFDDGALPINHNDGKILTAEFLLDEKNSLHIRMAEQGWQAIKITEQEGDDLIEASHFLQMPRDDKKQDENPFKYFLNYRIGWQHDDENGYRPSLYRFTGFSLED